MTRFFLAACLMLAAAVPVSGQVKRQHFPLLDSVYKNWQTDWLKRTGGTCDTFLYLQSIPEEVKWDFKETMEGRNRFVQHKPLDVFRFADTTNAEAVTFTQEEIDSIFRQFERMPKLRWPDTLFGPASKCIAGNTTDNYLAHIRAGTDSMRDKLCHKVHLISPPIILRNGSFCLFFDASVDILGMLGKLWLYRKENDEWRFFSPVETFMSF